ncbi:peptidoglycan-binding domain-containing protein, partial [Alsobacter sp. R-9]
APATTAAPAAQTAASDERTAAVPLPPRIQRQSSNVPATASTQPASVTAASAPPVPPAPIPTVQRDPIADMLKGGAAPAAEPDRSVLAAQRALNKLSYGPIKPDGLMGAGTRQAIERFERDRKLPVTGQPAGRTARELASASGIAIE